MTSHDTPTKTDSRDDVDGGYAWIIVLVVMLNLLIANVVFTAFGVLYFEYAHAFDSGVGHIGIAVSAFGIAMHLAGIYLIATSCNEIYWRSQFYTSSYAALQAVVLTRF